MVTRLGEGGGRNSIQLLLHIALTQRQLSLKGWDHHQW